MPDQPSNAEIKDAFDAHSKADSAFQEEQRGFNGENAQFRAETEGALADLTAKLGDLHTKVEGLATKDDIKEVMEFMKSVNIGLGVFRFTWQNAANIGSFLALIFAIFLFFKIGIAGIISWAFGK